MLPRETQNRLRMQDSLRLPNLPVFAKKSPKFAKNPLKGGQKIPGGEGGRQNLCFRVGRRHPTENKAFAYPPPRTHTSFPELEDPEAKAVVEEPGMRLSSR